MDDVYTYFGQKESEFRELSLRSDGAYSDMFSEESGSSGRRGRILGNLTLDDRSFLAVYELVEVVHNHVARLEYAYYLVVDGEEIWGYEHDLSHDPPIHRHTAGHRERLVADEMSFKAVAELAWVEVSKRAEADNA